MLNSHRKTARNIINDNRYELSCQIRSLRQIENITIEELSVKSNMDINILKNFEMGDFRDIGNFNKLLNYFNKELKMMIK